MFVRSKVTTATGGQSRVFRPHVDYTSARHTSVFIVGEVRAAVPQAQLPFVAIEGALTGGKTVSASEYAQAPASPESAVGASRHPAGSECKG